MHAHTFPPKPWLFSKPVCPCTLAEASEPSSSLVTLLLTALFALRSGDWRSRFDGMPDLHLDEPEHIHVLKVDVLATVKEGKVLYIKEEEEQL